MNCPFCTIPKTEKHRMLFEGKTTVAILANPRMMPGHTLVIPKRHVKKLSELKKEERKEVMQTIINFEEKITKKIASGCDIRRHYRPYEANQGRHVEHVHIHLQPRSEGDAINQQMEPIQKELIGSLKDKEREEMMGKLGA